MKLTALHVRLAKGRERPYKISDGGGLYLHVTPKGARYWRFAYRFLGKQKMLSFGVFPNIGLADARARRDEARGILATGRDPIAVARDQAAETRLAESGTFKAVAEEWIAKCERDGRAPITISKQRWLLGLACKKLGDRPMNRIKAQEVFEALRAIEAKGFYETARRMRSNCGQVFRYAVATGRAERDVCVDLRSALTTPKTKHLAAITDLDGVGELMRRIDGYRVTLAALRLSPHVFVRPGELRQAEWADFDFERRTWSIPAERMKMRRIHRVPLSDQALAIIEEIRSVTGRWRYVFPCLGRWDRPMSEGAINLALRRLGYTGDEMTAHGFRAMASTLLNECGRWNPDAIERQLAHVDGNNVRRIYARGEYWDERVRMMQAWSDQLDELRAIAVARAELSGTDQMALVG